MYSIMSRSRRYSLEVREQGVATCAASSMAPSSPTVLSADRRVGASRTLSEAACPRRPREALFERDAAELQRLLSIATETAISLDSLHRRLAEAGVESSVGSRADSYESALAESVTGVYKTEVIRQRVR